MKNGMWHLLLNTPLVRRFFDMVFDPDYRAIVHHRTAAVETSRLIRLKPQPIGEGFG